MGIQWQAGSCRCLEDHGQWSSRRSGGRSQRRKLHFVAKLVELLDRLAFGLFAVGALEMIGPEILEYCSVREHVPHGNDHGS